MTQDEIAQAMQDTAGNSWGTESHFQRFAKLVAEKATAAEREACAKVVEDSPSYDWHKFACETASAIRARGQA
jgi:hypothetical protein